jgi:chromosomal replication initiator protein
VGTTPWKRCLERLEGELSPQQFNTWIRPLHAIEEENAIRLLAPNRFVLDWVSEKYLSRMEELLDKESTDTEQIALNMEIGSKNNNKTEKKAAAIETSPTEAIKTKQSAPQVKHSSNLNTSFTFDSFVQGNSNQLARAASMQVAENPGNAYNPLFIYGGVGLGKTHLMHAVGAAILEKKPSANIAYLHSERFVADMVRALQHNAIN